MFKTKTQTVYKHTRMSEVFRVEVLPITSRNLDGWVRITNKTNTVREYVLADEKFWRALGDRWVIYVRALYNPVNSSIRYMNTVKDLRWNNDIK